MTDKYTPVVETLKRLAWAAFLAFCAVLLLIGFGLGRASAQSGTHGAGHAENHDWYKDLKMRSGASCCNGQRQLPGGQIQGDCRPVKARPRDSGEWEALVDGEWRLIPPDAILPDHLNKEPLHAHICAHQQGMIYCFLRAGPGG